MKSNDQKETHLIVLQSYSDVSANRMNRPFCSRKIPLMDYSDDDDDNDSGDHHDNGEDQEEPPKKRLNLGS